MATAVVHTENNERRQHNMQTVKASRISQRTWCYTQTLLSNCLQCTVN